MSSLFGIGGGGNVGASDSFYPVTIDDSLRFEDGSSAYLSRTPASAGDRRTWTWSGWLKKSSNGVYNPLFYANAGGNSNFQIQFLSTDVLRVFQQISGVDTYYIITSQVFRDPSAWYHIVVAQDTTQATAADRLVMYVNGEKVTAFSNTKYPSQNYNSGTVNSTSAHYVGYSITFDLDGYLSDINFIDGQALDHTSFGEFKDGVWIPIEYTGTYGDNGFHLEFDGAVTDSSGNGNDWTANNISAHDYVLDSPTNNFAVLNPLYSSTSTSYPTPALSEGNLAASTSSGSNWKTVPTTMYMSTGKWYAEVKVTYTDYADSFIGFASKEFYGQDYTPSNTAFGYQFHPSLGIRHNSTQLSAQTFTQGDIIGLALNMDDNEIKFYKNGSLLYTATSVAAGSWSVSLTLLYTKTLYANFGQDSTFAGNETAGGNTDANGIGDFKYAPPDGHLALCTANLPTPTIVDGSTAFSTVLYSGTGSSNAVTGVGFQNDLLWIKSRTDGAGTHRLIDSVRGGSLALQSDGIGDEVDNSAQVTSPRDSDGFTVDGNTSAFNQSGDTYVAWNWLAGGAASSIAVDAYSSGVPSIASSVSANTDAGFSILTYSGSGANATIGHGLDSPPEMIIIKRLADANWTVGHFPAIGNGEYLKLNDPGDVNIASTVWNSTSPTSNVFHVGTSSATNIENNYVAYCFHSVDGYSKVGSYISNYSTNGPFVYTGFRPAFVIIKKLGASRHWYVMDSTRTTYNGSQNWLSPSQATTEDASTGENVDFLSNGFKIRTQWTSLNDSGSATYIYIAFAESPFKYANAR